MSIVIPVPERELLFFHLIEQVETHLNNSWIGQLMIEPLCTYTVLKDNKQGMPTVLVSIPIIRKRWKLYLVG